MNLLLTHTLAQRAHVFANVVRRIQDLTGQKVFKGRPTQRAFLQPLGSRYIIGGFDQRPILQADTKSENFLLA